MKAQFTDIVPGRILYEVFCVDGGDTPSMLRKIIVTSHPVVDQHNIGLQFSSTDIWNTWEQKNATHFLNTYHIKNNYNEMFTTAHNLHRLFVSKEGAKKYMEECLSGKFTDLDDQVYYDSCTKEYKQERDLNLKAIDDLCDSIIFDHEHY